jgi:predicted AAA+ superfamily ATPase
MNVPRKLKILDTLTQRSCFLFGPRQTGKSWLIRNTLQNCKVYNLLDSQTYLQLSSRPSRIREELQPTDSIVVIDEIQKLPALLDEAHFLIEEKGVRFLLTGSSARKLRLKGTNLLGGRARKKTMHPFIFQELGDEFDLVRALDTGLLPPIYFSADPHSDLESYAGVYLREEIAAEAVVRNIPSFSRFMTVAALSHAQIVNFSNVAADAQVSRTTVHEYFEILKDTLICIELPAWKKTVKRKPFSTSKYYFFDGGVARMLQQRKGLKLGSTESGEAFESFVFHELRTWLDYGAGGDLCYWRSTSGFEVDFILNNHVAIEVKAKTNVANHDMKGIRALKEETLFKHYFVVSLETTPRRVDDFEILPWQQFLQMLWSGDIA